MLRRIKPIRTETDYQQALSRVESLMDVEPNSEAFDELEVLAILVENYEMKNYAIDAPDPIETMKVREISSQT